MNVAFIVDASSKIGLGHWSRCINFSKILRKKNYFFSRYYPHEHKKLNNINLIKIKKNKFNIKELKEKIKKYDIKILIIDNYYFNYKLQKQIKKYVYKLIVIDDYYNKKHFCDILLNYSFLDKKEKLILKKNNPKAVLALGPKYLPLNLKFIELKKKVKLRKNVKKILVFFGGSDSLNMTEKLIVISKFFHNIKFSIILGSLNKRRMEISKKVKNYKNIKLFCSIKNEKMANLISNSDLAIGAGGVNLFERIYLGLPSIVVDVNKNQHTNIKNSKKRELIRHLNYKSFTIDKLKMLIQEFLENEEKFYKISKKCFYHLKYDQKKYLRGLVFLSNKYL